MRNNYGNLIKQFADREYTGNVIALDNVSHSRIRGLSVFGKTAQVTTTGAQLLDASKMSAYSGTTFEILENGYTIKVTSGSSYSRIIYNLNQEINGKNVAIAIDGATVEANNKTTAQLSIFNEDGTTSYFTLNDSTKLKYENIEIPSNAVKCVFAIYANNSATTYESPFTTTVYGARLVLQENVLLGWEPYTGGIAVPSPQYPQELVSVGDNGNISVNLLDDVNNTQSLTIQMPNGLLAIPVDSDGNYTDENGQQWIADEVDFTKGKYIRRIGRIEAYNDEIIATPYVSTTGELSEGAKVYYVLSSPVETDLSAEEIVAYKELHVNIPNTTIQLDEVSGLGYINATLQTKE